MAASGSYEAKSHESTKVVVYITTTTVVYKKVAMLRISAVCHNGLVFNQKINGRHDVAQTPRANIWLVQL